MYVYIYTYIYIHIYTYTYIYIYIYKGLLGGDGRALDGGVGLRMITGSRLNTEYN